jgi:hypothetical protein
MPLKLKVEEVAVEEEASVVAEVAEEEDSAEAEEVEEEDSTLWPEHKKVEPLCQIQETMS